MERGKLDFDSYNVPEGVREGLDLYINNHVPPGGFLTAVLKNSLMESFALADETNKQYLFKIVSFLYNEAPDVCWGSPEKVARWLAPQGVTK